MENIVGLEDVVIAILPIYAATIFSKIDEIHQCYIVELISVL